MVLKVLKPGVNPVCPLLYYAYDTLDEIHSPALPSYHEGSLLQLSLPVFLFEWISWRSQSEQYKNFSHASLLEEKQHWPRMRRLPPALMLVLAGLDGQTAPELGAFYWGYFLPAAHLAAYSANGDQRLERETQTHPDKLGTGIRSSPRRLKKEMLSLVVSMDSKPTDLVTRTWQVSYLSSILFHIYSVYFVYVTRQEIENKSPLMHKNHMIPADIERIPQLLTQK